MVKCIFQFHLVTSHPVNTSIESNINSNAFLKKYQVKNYNAIWLFNWGLITSSAEKTE